MASEPFCTWGCCGSNEKSPHPPIVSCVWALGSQLVALLEKVREPFRGGARLTKIHHWRLTLKTFRLAPFHVLSSCFGTVVAVWSAVSKTCHYAFLKWWTVYPGIVSQNKPFLQAVSCQTFFFITVRLKVTNTMNFKLSNIPYQLHKHQASRQLLFVYIVYWTFFCYCFVCLHLLQSIIQMASIPLNSLETRKRLLASSCGGTYL